MSSCFKVRPRIHVCGTLFSCLIMAMAGQLVQAEDEPAPSSRTLEELKQRSAQERWQRVKRQFATEATTAGRAIPSPLPHETPRNSTTEDGLSVPADGSLIPRLSAPAATDASDWILTTRPPVLDPKPAPAPASVPELSNEVPESAINGPLPVRIANADVDQNKGEKKADSEEAKDEPKPESADESGNDSPRSPMERLIGTIKPHYDRDEDSDIRKYALEKAKEFKIEFKSKAYEERAFPQINLAWEASNQWYYPLYFADPALERSGHSHHPLIQPFASIGRAAFQLGMLPYQMTITPPWSQEYPVGYYRPGEYAPKLHYQLPLNAEAAAVEAGVVTGLYFVIP